MKCPECVKEGEKSTVVIGYGSTTDMGWQPYYDEDGEFHDHDPNWHGYNYRCSRGHEWYVSRQEKCPACGEWWATDGKEE